MPKKTAHSKGHWRSDQENKKVQQKVKLALLVLGLILILVIVSNAVRLIANFHQPLTPGLSSPRVLLWEDKYPINLVLETGSLSVISFDPTQKEIKVINLSNVVVGDSNSKKDLKSNLEIILGVPIDGYIGLDSNFSSYTPLEVVKKLMSNPLEWFLNLKSISSDLTPKELVNLAFSLSNIRFDKISEVEIEGELESFVSKYFVDTNIRNDQASIAIFNATNTPGLAQKAARVVNNLGGNVIIVTSAENSTLEKSYIYSSPDAPLYTKNRLTRIFTPNCTESSSCDILEDSDITSSRAQINIVLGQDFISKF
jgi:hypothetical protein